MSPEGQSILPAPGVDPSATPTTRIALPRSSRTACAWISRGSATDAAGTPSPRSVVRRRVASCCRCMGCRSAAHSVCFYRAARGRDHRSIEGRHEALPSANWRRAFLPLGEQMIRLILYGAWALWPPIVVAGQNASSESVSGSPIRWELIERFPLLSPQVMDRLDRARRDGEFEGTRAGPVSAIQLFRWFESGWRPGQPILADPASTAYDSASGRYKRSYVAQRGDRVGALFRLVKPGQAGARCSWRILEPEPIATASGPCGDGVALDIPLELAVEVEVTVLGGDASELFRETVEARQHVVVAMGDSYASGEGNPDIPAQYSGPMPLTPGADWLFNRDRERNVNAAAQWWDKECHRSLVSWPVLP